MKIRNIGKKIRNTIDSRKEKKNKEKEELQKDTISIKIENGKVTIKDDKDILTTTVQEKNEQEKKKMRETIVDENFAWLKEKWNGEEPDMYKRTVFIENFKNIDPNVYQACKKFDDTCCEGEKNAVKKYLTGKCIVTREDIKKKKISTFMKGLVAKKFIPAGQAMKEKIHGLMKSKKVKKMAMKGLFMVVGSAIAIFGAKISQFQSNEKLQANEKQGMIKTVAEEAGNELANKKDSNVENNKEDNGRKEFLDEMRNLADQGIKTMKNQTHNEEKVKEKKGTYFGDEATVKEAEFYAACDKTGNSNNMKNKDNQRVTIGMATVIDPENNIFCRYLPDEESGFIYKTEGVSDTIVGCYKKDQITLEQIAEEYKDANVMVTLGSNGWASWEDVKIAFEKERAIQELLGEER